LFHAKDVVTTIVELGPGLVFVEFYKILDSFAILSKGKFMNGVLGISNWVGWSEIPSEFPFEKGPIFENRRVNSCIVGLADKWGEIVLGSTMEIAKCICDTGSLLLIILGPGDKSCGASNEKSVKGFQIRAIEGVGR